MKKPQNKRLFMMAALLATSSALDFDDFSDDNGLGIRATFESEDGANGSDTREIVTQDRFRIAIDRVAIQSDEIDVRPRDEGDLDRILAQLERPTVDITPGFEPEPDLAELVLTNARFEGRVFDETGTRLPAEGLGISGHVPLNVRVHRTDDAKRPVDVRFEVPTGFFDGIDWAA